MRLRSSAGVAQMIGLMGAMAEEISLYKSYADITETKTYAGAEFHRGVIDGSEVVLTQCGNGKVNGAVSTQILIDRYDVDKIILTGLAGTVVPYLQSGDIVAANYLVQYDVDLSVFGRRVGDVPDVGRMIEVDAGLLKAVTDSYDEVFKNKPDRPQLVVGTIVSGDRFISDRKTISWLQRELGAVAIEMEGAAVAQVCHMNRKPFLILRTISDDADEKATEHFSKALEMAPINTFALIRNFISSRSLLPI